MLRVSSRSINRVKLGTWTKSTALSCRLCTPRDKSGISHSSVLWYICWKFANAVDRWVRVWSRTNTINEQRRRRHEIILSLDLCIMNVISVDPSYAEGILIRGNSVIICTPNHGSLCRRTFNFDADKQPIIQALFTHFSNVSSSAKSSASSELPSSTNRPDQSPARPNIPAKALVVVLKTLMHIIYLDGGSYIMHLPFPVLKVWPISLGLLIERQSDSEQGPMSTDRAFANEEPLPRLFTLSSPLEDFGMVACNGPSLASDEEILFISSQSDSLCLTRNME